MSWTGRGKGGFSSNHPMNQNPHLPPFHHPSSLHSRNGPPPSSFQQQYRNQRGQLNQPQRQYFQLHHHPHPHQQQQQRYPLQQHQFQNHPQQQKPFFQHPLPPSQNKRPQRTTTTSSSNRFNPPSTIHHQQQRRPNIPPPPPQPIISRHLSSFPSSKPRTNHHHYHSPSLSHNLNQPRMSFQQQIHNHPLSSHNYNYNHNQPHPHPHSPSIFHSHSLPQSSLSRSSQGLLRQQQQQQQTRFHPTKYPNSYHPDSSPPARPRISPLYSFQRQQQQEYRNVPMRNGPSNLYQQSQIQRQHQFQQQQQRQHHHHHHYPQQFQQTHLHHVNQQHHHFVPYPHRLYNNPSNHTTATTTPNYYKLSQQPIQNNGKRSISSSSLELEETIHEIMGLARPRSVLPLERVVFMIRTFLNCGSSFPYMEFQKRVRDCYFGKPFKEAIVDLFVHLGYKTIIRRGNTDITVNSPAKFNAKIVFQTAIYLSPSSSIEQQERKSEAEEKEESGEEEEEDERKDVGNEEEEEKKKKEDRNGEKEEKKKGEVEICEKENGDFDCTIKTHITKVNCGGFDLRVVVTSSEEICKKECSQFLDSFQEGEFKVVGLDCEWFPNISRYLPSPLAILQLSFGTTILVVQLLGIEGGFPQCLCDLFQRENVILVGYGIVHDVEKILRSSSLNEVRIFDLKLLGISGGLRGLLALVSDMRGLQIQKDFSITLSNWNRRRLSPQQIRYCATDAFSTYQAAIQSFTKRNSIKFPLFEGEKVTFEQKEEGKAILQFFKKIEEVFEKKKSKKNLEPLVIFIEGGKRGGERRKEEEENGDEEKEEEENRQKEEGEEMFESGEEERSYCEYSDQEFELEDE